MTLLNTKEKRKKKWRAWRKASWKAWKEGRKTIYNELDKPIPDGWWLYFHLRDDIARRDDAPSIWAALKLVANEYRTNNEKVIRIVRRDRTFGGLKKAFPNYDLHGRIHYHYCGPIIKLIEPKVWENLDPSVKKWFSRYQDWRYRRNSKWYEMYRLNIPEYWLIVKDRPCVITHLGTPNSLAKQEEAYYDAKLHQEYWWRSEGTNRGRRHWRNNKSNERVAVKANIRKFMAGEVNEIYDKKRLPRECKQSNWQESLMENG